jgi:hypothetical protein
MSSQPKRTAALIVCAWLAIGAWWCSTAATDAAASTRASTSAKPTKTLQKGDRYVSVGSSLASGFGIANQSTDCGRSDRSYAHIVAARFKLQLVDVSCGGAVIPNVLDTPQGDHPPQVDAVTANTKLITIGMGGNDINYNATAVVCGNPATVCSEPPTLAADEAALPGKLDTMISKLKATAPSATIVLVTYPREIPRTNCPAVSFTDQELAILQPMGATVERDLVAAAHGNHLLLADPYAQRGDHTACAPASTQWAAGHVVPDGSGFPYHPTPLGHEVMATLIIKALRG